MIFDRDLKQNKTFPLSAHFLACVGGQSGQKTHHLTVNISDRLHVGNMLHIQLGVKRMHFLGTLIRANLKRNVLVFDSILTTQSIFKYFCIDGPDLLVSNIETSQLLAPKLFETLLCVPKVREDITTIKFLIKAFDQRCWKWKFAFFFQAM